MSTTPETYKLGGTTPYPVTAAGLAQCAIDDLAATDSCVASYLSQFADCKATACQTAETSPLAESLVQLHLGKSSAEILQSSFKPTVQKVIGLGTTWLKGDIEKEVILYVVDTLKSINIQKQPRPQYQVEVFVHDSRIVSAGSQFGHVSIAIGDKLYSMSHSGLFQGITDVYIARQQTFRDSIGFVLDVSPEEAQRIEARMLSFDGTSYDLLTNSCTTTVTQALESIGIQATDPRFLSWTETPTELTTALSHSSRIIRVNHYDKN